MNRKEIKTLLPPPVSRCHKQTTAAKTGGCCALADHAQANSRRAQDGGTWKGAAHDGGRHLGIRSGRRATVPSAGEGATLESGPAVAGGGARSSRRYGNVVGREVVGHMGGLVTTSTDRGDGRWLVATNEANPYFRLGGIAPSQRKERGAGDTCGER
jgi:hypothetical protein